MVNDLLIGCESIDSSTILSMTADTEFIRAVYTEMGLRLRAKEQDTIRNGELKIGRQKNKRGAVEQQSDVLKSLVRAQRADKKKNTEKALGMDVNKVLDFNVSLKTALIVTSKCMIKMLTIVVLLGLLGWGMVVLTEKVVTSVSFPADGAAADNNKVRPVCCLPSPLSHCSHYILSYRSRVCSCLDLRLAV